MSMADGNKPWSTAENSQIPTQHLIQRKLIGIVGYLNQGRGCYLATATRIPIEELSGWVVLEINGDSTSLM